MTMANSGLPYPIRCSADDCAQIELPGVPLGSFQGSTYDEVTFPLQAGDVFVFCSDGVFEAMNEAGAGIHVGAAHRSRRPVARPAAPKIVDAIFAAVAEWRGETPPNDDMTAVVVRITQ